MDARGWAVGLTEQQFLQEFMRRMPRADSVPLQCEYVLGLDPVYKGIDGVSPEDLMMENPKLKLSNTDIKEEVKPIKKKYACRGCGRVFDFAVARSGHERGCKIKLQMKEI